jgi:hypothetical protein
MFVTPLCHQGITGTGIVDLQGHEFILDILQC